MLAHGSEETKDGSNRKEGKSRTASVVQECPLAGGGGIARAWKGVPCWSLSNSDAPTERNTHRLSQAPF